MRSAVITLRVVEALARRGSAGVSDLARDVALPKSTAQRCLVAAAEAGWIVAGPSEPTRWAISPHVLTLLASGVVPDLRDVARPVMEALARRTGDAVHLVARDGADLVLLERIAGDHPVQVVIPVGFRVPMHAGATGKAMLAAMTVDEVDALVPARPARLTDRTVASRRTLHGELQQIRAAGYAVNSGEWDATVAAVAAVIVDPTGRPVAALSVSTTPNRLPSERVAELAPRVITAARTISAAVGHPVPTR